MSFRFCDSFDHYVTGTMAEKYNSVAGVSLGTGRHGTGVGGNGTFAKTLDMQSSWTIGFAANGIGGVAPTNPYVLYALSTSGNLLQVAVLRLNVDGSLTVLTPGATIGNSPAYDWTGYHYVELQIALSGTATATASCILRVNSETVVSGAASTTQPVSTIYGGAAKANYHVFSPSVSGTIDDLYINDGAGSTNTGFMGDVQIKVIRPNGDVTINWTGTGSSTGTHYLNVNGTGEPDDDTSYVYSTATGSMELYEWEDISAFTGTVKGVQYLLYARKDDEGARVIQMVEGSSGTNTLTNATTGLADIYLNDTYQYHHVALDTSPTTGTGWTVTDFNADRFGFRVGTNT